MASVDVECPECAQMMQVEEAQLGERVKCPKCKFVFASEKAGGAYELSDPPSRPKSSRRSVNAPSPEPEADDGSESDRELRERMERWANDA